MKKMKSKKITQPEKINVLLTFLKRTKNGKYAKIDKDSLRYSRLQFGAETSPLDENLQYGLS